MAVPPCRATKRAIINVDCESKTITVKIWMETMGPSDNGGYWQERHKTDSWRNAMCYVGSAGVTVENLETAREVWKTISAELLIKREVKFYYVVKVGPMFLTEFTAGINSCDDEYFSRKTKNGRFHTERGTKRKI